MRIPFSLDAFFGVFTRYNQSVWPMQIVLMALAVAAMVLLCRGRHSESRYISAVLSVLWLWMAIAYHLVFFTEINPAAWLFGVVFLFGAASFLWSGCIRNKLRFVMGGGVRAWLGGLLIGFALVVYPVIGHVLGHRYPAVPTFGTPCPTTIFTLGMLLFAERPVPKSVFVVPLFWAAVGSMAAFQLGVRQDLGLLAAGSTVLAVTILTPRHSEAHGDPTSG
jgi:Family of unknown function (DUF6064)